MSNDCDVPVAGAGCGGICAAVQAARQGARVLLVERAAQVGGTGIHAPVALVCKFQRRDTYEPINRGLHQEFFPQAYAWRGEFTDEDLLPTYDHEDLARRYAAALAAAPGLEVRTACAVVGVDLEPHPDGRRIAAVRLADGSRVRCSVAVDGTADGHLSAMAGADFHLGRDSDGAMQAATLTFALRGFDGARLRNPAITTWGGFRSLNQELDALRRSERGDQADHDRFGTGCFAYPDGRTLLFNANHVTGVDPTRPETVARGLAEARVLVERSVELIRRHPAFAPASLAFVSPWLGVREGRRIVGDHILSADECLGEARCEDAVAAGAYDIDIHDPDGGPAHMQRIPNTQYYHIPYRSLRPVGIANLLLASRCLSGDFTAHSSYRVMSTISAVGQAAGCAAALAIVCGGETRAVDPAWIRHALVAAGQWAEGSCRPAPMAIGLAAQPSSALQAVVDRSGS